MRKLLRGLYVLVTAGALSISCGAPSKPVVSCKLPARPALPEVVLVECDWENKPYICATVQEMVDIALYARSAERYFNAAEVCRGK